jgi:type I restriction enzyme S subunit
MSFGNPFIMKTSGYIHDGWFVLRLPDYIDTDYFYYLLTSPNVQEQIQFLASGAIVKNISGDLVKRVSLSYPKSLSEQKRIVEILDEAFAAIDKAKANVEKNLQNAKELFESVKNKIFQNLVSNVGTVPLASACNEIFAGGDAPANNFSQIKTEKYKIPIIANAVKDNGLYGYTDLIRVNKPSVTIAARGSGTGHTEIRNEPFFPIVRLIVLVPNIEIITLEFLKYSIQNLEILSSGSAIPQLTVPMIKEYSVPLPLKSEQETIVKKLDTLNAETKKLETIYQQKLNDLEELKKSILQKAFSGELTAKEVV